MSRTDDDTWDIIESVGATALGVAGLAGTTAQPNVDGRSLGRARCVPFANPSVARHPSAGSVGDRARSPAPQAPCSERCPAPNAAMTI